MSRNLPPSVEQRRYLQQQLWSQGAQPSGDLSSGIQRGAAAVMAGLLARKDNMQSKEADIALADALAKSAQGVPGWTNPNTGEAAIAPVPAGPEAAVAQLRSQPGYESNPYIRQQANDMAAQAAKLEQDKMLTMFSQGMNYDRYKGVSPLQGYNQMQAAKAAAEKAGSLSGQYGFYGIRPDEAGMLERAKLAKEGTIMLSPGQTYLDPAGRPGFVADPNKNMQGDYVNGKLQIQPVAGATDAIKSVAGAEAAGKAAYDFPKDVVVSTPQGDKIFTAEQLANMAQSGGVPIVSKSTQDLRTEQNKQLVEEYKALKPRVDGIKYIDEALSRIDSAYTGGGANAKTYLANLVVGLGFGTEEMAKAAGSTQELGAMLGRGVMANAKTLGINPTDTDLNFLMRVEAGEVSLQPEAIRNVLRIQKLFTLEAAKRYNAEIKRIGSVNSTETGGLTIPLPARANPFMGEDGARRKQNMLDMYGGR